MATAGKRSADDGGDEPAARRQRTLKVINPDLTVIVEDTKVQVNSIFLQLNSPVFAAMLATEMKEGQSKEVVLPGKTMDEFCLFYQHLQACYAVTAADALILCSWANEYQVDALRDACDTALANDIVDSKRLIIASKFNLPKLLAKCTEHYCRAEKPFLGSLCGGSLRGEEALLGLADVVKMQDGAAALAQIWPDISRTLGIQCEDHPSAETVKFLWPIVENLVHAKSFASAEQKSALRAACRAREWQSGLQSVPGILYYRAKSKKNKMVYRFTADVAEERTKILNHIQDVKERVDTIQ